MEEINNWIFRYDTRTKQWVGFDCRGIDVFVDKKFSSILKAPDIQDLIINILELKQKQRDGQ